MDSSNLFSRYKNYPHGIVGACYCKDCGFVVDMDTSEDIISNVPSPVPHLIGKNSMPATIQERTQIQDGIYVAEAELALVEDELCRLARMEYHLKARRNALNKFRDEHRRLNEFNPTYYLPKEIWMEIFFHHQAFLQSEALPKSLPKSKPDSTKDIISSFHPAHGPLLLAKVCRTWRKIILTTAGFWSKIRLVLDKWHMTQRTLGLLDLWHQRSREATLDIQLLLYYAPEYSAEASAHKTDVLQKLATQSRRWEKLYLVAPPSYVAKGLWSIRHHLPALRKCIIHCPENTGHSWLTRELGEDIFEIAPKLDTLILDNSLSLLKNLRFPYHQLTSLDVKRCLRRFNGGDILTPVECIQLLQLCPELRSCKLTCGYWDGRTVPEFMHTCLRELRLYGATQGRTEEFGDDGIGIFLENFTAPMLQALSLDLRTPSMHAPSSWECTQLCEFLDRCHRLKHLSITAFDPLDTPKDLIQYLIACPENIEFDFWLSDDIGEDFLDELEGYLHDESGALSWLPEKVYYSYIPDRLEHMVVGTKRFFEDDEMGGYVYRASEGEIVEGWKYSHACCAVAFSYMRDERWDTKRALPPVFV